MACLACIQINTRAPAMHKTKPQSAKPPSSCEPAPLHRAPGHAAGVGDRKNTPVPPKTQKNGGGYFQTSSLIDEYSLETPNSSLARWAFLEVGWAGCVLSNPQARQIRGGVVWIGYARGFKPLKNKQWSFVSVRQTVL